MKNALLVITAAAILIVAAGLAYAYACAQKSEGTPPGAIPGAPTYDLFVKATVQYNPLDLLGSRWYIPSNKIGTTWDAHRVKLLDSQCALGVFETGDLKLVETASRVDTGEVARSTEHGVAPFSQITGGEASVDMVLPNLAAGAYKIKFQLYENGVLRTEQESITTVGG